MAVFPPTRLFDAVAHQLSKRGGSSLRLALLLFFCMFRSPSPIPPPLESWCATASKRWVGGKPAPLPPENGAYFQKRRVGISSTRARGPFGFCGGGLSWVYSSLKTLCFFKEGGTGRGIKLFFLFVTSILFPFLFVNRFFLFFKPLCFAIYHFLLYYYRFLWGA